jgi:hypothetical protein
MATRRVLKKGMKGADVTKLQKLLKLKIKKYGYFGDVTHAAVVKYQKAHKLTADGIVGPDTWLHLTQPKKQPVKKAVAKVKAAVKKLPSPGWAMTTARKKAVYGHNASEVRSNLKRVEWKRKNKVFYIHKRHYAQVVRAIAKIDKYEIANNLDYKIHSVGTFNWRLVRGGKTLSNHSFAGAIDFNPGQNPMGYKLKTDMPKYFINAWKSEGARWGGNYRGRKDAMHFEF